MSQAQTEDLTGATAPPPAKKKFLTVGLVVGIMLVEGVGVFVAVRMTTHPAAGEAVEVPVDPSQLLEQMDVEVPLIECDAINRKSGQALVVHLAISVRVAAENQERAAKLIEKRQSSIKDRMQMILRSADPQILNEPNLETLKRLILAELTKLLEDDKLVLEVLIPQILQSQTRL